MSVLTGKELRIVGFLCNWCSYGGADTAGVGRFVQPTDLRIIRVPCSGRIDPLFIVKALLNGADGVLVSGCHPRDCHYSQGNFYARRRLEVLKHFLPVLGIDPARFEYTWVSASEAQRWQKVVSSFTERIHKLGPASRLENTALPDGLEKRFAAIASGELPSDGKAATRLEELKDRIHEFLPDLDIVIGWQRGFDALHNTPLFMRSAEDLEKLVWGPLNIHNTATYLPSLRGKKVGVVVKGCDSRSVVELLQEKLVDRENIVVFGMPCSGIVDLSKIDRALRERGTGIGRVQAAECGEKGVTIKAGGQEYRFAMEEVAADKCFHCEYPNAVLADHLIGNASPSSSNGKISRQLAAFDAMSLQERMAYWRSQMDRCIRCHACRNACPLCVCKDHCIAQSRDPHWISQEDTITEKLMFQVVHAVHTAGRCTECGECERACPMDIPILAMKRQMNRAIRELFEYKAGTDPEAVPPLLAFQAEEKNIHEGVL
ncbi:MAG: hydrogenase iron-sulfur subunit [Desulfobacteraceae bacterium]|nr:hydrogenase iron-sulfur subunit [Desulfobacteraceae bacterium]